MIFYTIMIFNNKNIIKAIVPFTVLFVLSCSSTVRTTRLAVYPENFSNDPIIVYDINENIPDQTEIIGMIKIGDSGFSVNCDFEYVVDRAKNECKKIGGNALQLVSISKPDLVSSCYRITANVLRLPPMEYIDVSKQDTGFNEDNIKEEWNKTGIDEIEGIYESLIANQNGKYRIAIIKISNTEYHAIYLAGSSGYDSSKWNEGDLKAEILVTAIPYLYKVIWYDEDKTINENQYLRVSLKILV